VRLTVRIFMHRGDVWLINLDPTVGAEIKKELREPNEVIVDDSEK